MKKITTLLFAVCFLFVYTLTAQKNHHPQILTKKLKTSKKAIGNEQNGTISNVQSPVPIPNETAESRMIEPEVWVGETTYDLQTNSAGLNRIFADPSGTVSTVWTFHDEPTSGFPLRGTGYNFFDPTGDGWSDPPSDRLEASTRTGWPNVGTTANGREVVICHDFSAHELLVLTKDQGQTMWNESIIPTNAAGIVWSRMAVGANNTLHVIAVTSPVNIGGQIYQGLDPALLYFRSSDGGDTWDITDKLIDGITSDEVLQIGPDSYALDADANGNVAIGIFYQWADVMLLKSTDHGENWTKRIVHDFILEKYEINSGYTLDDIGGADPNGPAQFETATFEDSLAVFTSDESGSVVIDGNGIAHIAFGQMYLADADLTDAGWTFYPGWSGMSYWNENMADGAHETITVVEDALDVDGNGTTDIDGEIAFYSLSLTSMPALAIDASGNLVLAYSMVMENFQKEASTPDPMQHYRHIYLTALIDGIWQPPYDVINEDVLLFPVLLDSREAVFPSIDYANGLFQLYYQTDDEPGLNVQGDLDPTINNNTISVWTFDLNDIYLLDKTENVISPEKLNFNLYPNPASETVTIKFEILQHQKATIILTDMMGKKVGEITQRVSTDLAQEVEWDTADLSPGVYLVSLRTDNTLSTRRLVIY